MYPEGWEEVTLDRLAYVDPEKLSPKKIDEELVLNYIEISAVKQPGVISHIREVPFKDASSRARMLVQKDDILVSNVRPYLKSIAKINQSLNNLVASTGYSVVRPINNVDTEFLYQYLLSDYFTSQLVLNMRGSNYPAVTGKDVSNAKIYIPQLPEQRKIAAILGSVDEAIQATQKTIDQTRRVKQGLLNQLLTRGIGHTRFKQTEIGEIPEEWEVMTLLEVSNGKGKYGASVAKSDYDPNLPRYIRITDIDDQGRLTDFDPASIRHEDAQRYLLEYGDIIFARSGATVGKNYLYKPEHGLCAYAGYMIKFNLNQSLVIPEFIKFFCSSDLYTNWVLNTQRQLAQPNINAQEYGKLTIPIPSLEEQLKVVDIINGIENKLEAEYKNLNCLQHIKRGLMADLLSGRVRVTPDEQHTENVAAE